MEFILLLQLREKILLTLKRRGQSLIAWYLREASNSLRKPPTANARLNKPLI
jgi:hypothetical protein